MTSSSSPIAAAAAPSECRARRNPRLGSCSHGTGPCPASPPDAVGRGRGGSRSAHRRTPSPDRRPALTRPSRPRPRSRRGNLAATCFGSAPSRRAWAASSFSGRCVGGGVRLLSKFSCLMPPSSRLTRPARARIALQPARPVRSRSVPSSAHGLRRRVSARNRAEPSPATGPSLRPQGVPHRASLRPHRAEPSPATGPSLRPQPGRAFARNRAEPSPATRPRTARRPRLRVLYNSPPTGHIDPTSHSRLLSARAQLPRPRTYH